MSANDFSKEERVAFDEIVAGFEDALVLSKQVAVYNTDQTMMERTSDVIWRPQPFILSSYDGDDQSGNFQNGTQLSVPSTIGFKKSVPWQMKATELRDALQEGKLGNAAKQRLASDVNSAVMNVVCAQGSLVVKRTSAPSGFDDIAEAEAVMNEQGVYQHDRYIALSTRDYNNAASNLAGRQTLNGKTLTAYEKAYIGQLASFDSYKLDYANRIAAAAGGGGITIDTRSTAGNYWVPKATSVATTGERGNVDNRFQRITVSSTTNVAAGDAFTIAGVNSIHHIIKGDTGQLKTYRVISVDSSTTMTITPPIISNQGGSAAEKNYQNVIVTPSATAAITFLNTVAAAINPFWYKDSIEILPGRNAGPSDAGAKILSAVTENGIEISMEKQYDIKTKTTLFRADCYFGVVNLNTELNGIMIFRQT